jgi:hypothetical protein
VKSKKIISLSAFAFALYGGELFLASILSRDWVSNATALVSFADALKPIFPVIGHFDRIARYPEGLRVFLAITILLLPVKMLFIYKCFTASDRLNYRHFVVSPFSREKGLKPSNFVVDISPESGDKYKEDKYKKQRSLLSVVFSSFMIVLFSVFVLFVMMVGFGAEIPKGKAALLTSLGAKYNAIRFGGLGVWLVWACGQMTVCAAVATAGFCVIRDWVLFIFQKLRRD